MISLYLITALQTVAKCHPLVLGYCLNNEHWQQILTKMTLSAWLIQITCSKTTKTIAPADTNEAYVCPLTRHLLAEFQPTLPALLL